MSESNERRIDVQSLIAETAESLDGLASLLEELCAGADVPRVRQAQLHAVKDVLIACRDRMDTAADLLDA